MAWRTENHEGETGTRRMLSNIQVTRGEVARPRSEGFQFLAQDAQGCTLEACAPQRPKSFNIQYPTSNFQHPSNKGRGRATALRGLPIPCARCARMHAGSVRSPTPRRAFNIQY